MNQSGLLPRQQAHHLKSASLLSIHKKQLVYKFTTSVYYDKNFEREKKKSEAPGRKFDREKKNSQRRFLAEATKIILKAQKFARTRL